MTPGSFLSFWMPSSIPCFLPQLSLWKSPKHPSSITLAGNIIEQLRSVGCKIALDDFGIGLGSFGYLRNFKVDFIKIDGSFVRDITHGAVDFAIVKAINNIAHEIHSQTVAEFVEDESIMSMVRELGVDFAQGYGLGRPEPIEQIFVRAAQNSGLNAQGRIPGDAAFPQTPNLPGAFVHGPPESTVSDCG